MNREDLNTKAEMAIVLEGQGAEDLAVDDAFGAYTDEGETRSVRPKDALVEVSVTKVHAVPAWIKSQLEQLEVRRTARPLSERTSLLPVRQKD